MLRSRHVIFVHGMLGWGPADFFGLLPYWGRALPCFGPQLHAHEAKCGPVSSLHDRACELFAQIHGARVDYGAEHSEKAGHARFSRDYTGLGFAPDWSAKNPVVLIGHSAGATTCLALQKLLSEDFWGVGSTADWIEAVVSIAGCLNGSLLAYRICDDATGRMTGRPSDLVASGLGVASALLALGKRPLYDFHLEHWTDGRDGGLRALDATEFVSGDDNLAHDTTLQGAQALARDFVCAPETYYFSFVACATKDDHSPDRDMSLRLRRLSRYQANRPDFAAAPIEGWGEGDLAIDRWRANDGVISSISQRYPIGAPVGGEGIFDREGGFTPGCWYFENLNDALGAPFDHLDAVHGGPTKLSRASRRAHREFYRRLNALLLSL